MSDQLKSTWFLNLETKEEKARQQVYISNWNSKQDTFERKSCKKIEIKSARMQLILAEKKEAKASKVEKNSKP